MAMIDLNWNPTSRELRVFGVIMLIGCGIVGALAWSWGHPTVAKVVWGVGAVVGVVALVVPIAAKPVYLLLAVVSWPIGFVMSYVVLGIFYYVIITGTGLVFRLVGRDPLQRRLDPEASTYWQPKVLPDPQDRQRYFRQF